jgi:DNA-directed RNA polymerase subunit K/omega
LTTHSTTIAIGSYVTHSKLPDLGSGEVLAAEKGTIRIRFASGERAFQIDIVAPHLVVTDEAPARPVTAAKRARAKKAAAKKPSRAEPS